MTRYGFLDDVARTGEGLTSRAEVEAFADALLDAVSRYRVAGGSGYDLPGPRPSDNGPVVDALEGFSRTFLLASFRMRFAPAGRAAELADRYTEGLVSGSRGAWPVIDGLTQPLVEAGATALALLQTLDTVWTRLDAGEQGSVVDYLLAARSAPRPAGNWMWFLVIIELLLEAVGAGADHDAVDDLLERILRLRRPDGMWSDGGGARYDYYSSWAFSFYSGFWARQDGARRPDVEAALLAQALDQRLTLRSLFDDHGRAVPQGRSLIYRAATTAGLWAPSLFPGPQESGSGWIGDLTRNALRAVLSREDLGSPLPLGWVRSFPAIAQPYSGPGSPYWISKAFAGLILPPDAPAWGGGGEAPEPVAAVAPAGWLLQRGDGIVRVHNHGTWRTEEERDPHSRRFRDDPWYSRLAYSTATAPVVDAALRTDDGATAWPDNGVLFSEGIRRSGARVDVRLLSLESDAATSRWRPAGDGAPPEVESTTAIRGSDEVRIHRFSLGRPAVVHVTGYAIAADAVRTDLSADTATVVGAGVGCRLSTPIDGVPVILPAPGGVFGDRCGIPAARFDLGPGDHVIAVAVTLRSDSGTPAPAPQLRISYGRVGIRWADGTEQTR